MKIAISGASGFIGQHLVPFLTGLGHEVLPLVRSPARKGVRWLPQSGQIDAQALSGVEAAIHLAGETVAERWSEHKRTAIMNSRVQGTELLARTMANIDPRPRVLISASAVGYYGNRGDEVLTEESPPGNLFLSKVCQAWEAALQPAQAAGIRTASLRFGIVLSTTGGAFPKMAAPFEKGLGGRLGNGRQYMSWIDIDDTLRAINCILTDTNMSGPINIVAPYPVTNQEFTEKLSAVLHKPSFMPVPISMVHLAFGPQMSDEVLLASDRVKPKKLLEAGFEFQYPHIEQSLRHITSQHK